MRPISELVAERQTAARQVAQLNKRLEELDRELFARLGQALQALGVGSIDAATNLPENNGKQFSIFKNVPLPPRRETIGSTIVNAAVPILQQAGKPMKLNVLLEALERAGVHVPGDKPANNLSAHLSRSSKLVNTGRGWWLAAEKKEPPGGGP